MLTLKILSGLCAVAAGINAALFAATGDPVSLGLAVFTGIVAITSGVQR